MPRSIAVAFIATTLAGAPALAITTPALPHPATRVGNALPLHENSRIASAAIARRDAVLLAAEEQKIALQAQLADDQTDDCHDPVFELEDLIALTPPETLLGAMVKLRWLADEIAVMTGDEDGDELTIICCRQVLALIQRELAGGGFEGAVALHEAGPGVRQLEYIRSGTNQARVRD